MDTWMDTRKEVAAAMGTMRKEAAVAAARIVVKPPGFKA
jgi:hypothetical protein